MDTPHDQTEDQEYETDSGVTVDLDDIEVDIAPGPDGDIVTAQSDPEAYGIESDDDAETPST